MSFSIKQFLFCIAVVVIGLAALANADKLFIKELIDLLTVGILIFMAYSAWTSDGQRRAFRIGFVLWGLLYYWFFKHNFDIGTTEILFRLSPAFQKAIATSPASTSSPDLFGPPQLSQQRGPAVDWDKSYYSIGNALFLLLFALIGGCVTVYFYRKRQRTLNRK
jgi:hypothetical protein